MTEYLLFFIALLFIYLIMIVTDVREILLMKFISSPATKPDCGCKKVTPRNVN